jgi:hypothetical protein
VWFVRELGTSLSMHHDFLEKLQDGSRMESKSSRLLATASCFLNIIYIYIYIYIYIFAGLKPEAQAQGSSLQHLLYIYI